MQPSKERSQQLMPDGRQTCRTCAQVRTLILERMIHVEEEIGLARELDAHTLRNVVLAVLHIRHTRAR